MGRKATDIVPKHLSDEMRNLEGLGYTSWAQGTYLRLAEADDEGRTTLAAEVKAETFRRAAIVGEGLQSLFEALDLIKRFELFKKYGHSKMRTFLIQEVGPELGLHRTTLYQMAGALEERESQEREFGRSLASWSVNAKLAAESGRQRKGKGSIPQDKYNELRARAAAGAITKSEMRAELVVMQRGPHQSAAADSPPRKKLARANFSGGDEAGVAKNSHGATIEEPHLDPDPFAGLGEEDEPRAEDVGELARELERVTQEAAAMDQRLSLLEPAGWELVGEEGFRKAIESLARLCGRMASCLERAKATTPPEGINSVIECDLLGDLTDPFAEDEAEEPAA